MRTTRANNPIPGRDGRDRSSLRSRREFIGQGARTLGAGVAALVLCDLAELTEYVKASGVTTSSAEPLINDYDWSKHNYVYLIDLRKCIGCGCCVQACWRENDVPEAHFRTWVERYQVSRTGEVRVDSPHGGVNGFGPIVTGQDITKAFFFPKLCCHCTHTPCVQLCPVGASYRTPDGVVLVDEQRCIGCGYCVQACPYGSRFMHPVTHTASKCTLCYHRITRGLKNACVQACPVGARKLGDTKRVGDEIAEIIASQRVQVLQPELLTEPNCFYLGLTREGR